MPYEVLHFSGKQKKPAPAGLLLRARLWYARHELILMGASP